MCIVLTPLKHGNEFSSTSCCMVHFLGSLNQLYYYSITTILVGVSVWDKEVLDGLNLMFVNKADLRLTVLLIMGLTVLFT